MAATRKSSRTTAGNLPARFSDDIIEDGLHDNMAPNTSSHPDASFQGGQVRSGSRPRGRPRTRDLAKTSQRAQASIETSIASIDRVLYPPAAFPSLDPMAREVSNMQIKKPAAREQYDSTDFKATKSPKETKVTDETPEFEISYPSVTKYLVDRAYVDQDGNTLHGMASYYEAHAHDYDRQSRDSQGDSREKNKAFLQFLDTPEGQAAQLGGRGNSAREFEKWFREGRHSLYALGKEEKTRDGVDFRDKGFAALHFKLQYCIMSEIEEDLVRYPPKIRPYSTSGRSFRYARDILGIGSVAAVQGIQQKLEESKNQQKLMPKAEDYAQAKEFLKKRGLPITLIGLYDYLDKSTSVSK